MTVARIRSIDFDSAETANEYEQDVQENGANWVPEAELIMLIRTTDTSSLLLTTFETDEIAENVADRLAKWSETHGQSSWNNRYSDSVTLLGTVKAMHIKRRMT